MISILRLIATIPFIVPMVLLICRETPAAASRANSKEPALVSKQSKDIGTQRGTKRDPGDEKLAAMLADFEKYAEKAMADWRVPGMAIAIVRGDETIYKKGFGVKELGKSDPVTADTVFQIGSTSKAFTSALVAMLVDKGKVKWDEKVVSRLSDFRMHDLWVTNEFMVSDLMAQRSGLPEHALDNMALVGFDRSQIIHALRYVKPLTSFRSAYAYQNSLWLVAARLIESLSGESWSENVEKRIFAPLGMSSSSCDIDSFVTGKDVATLHRVIDGKITAIPMDWPYMIWPYIDGPAGGINSNVRDIVKWIRMQASLGSLGDKEIISQASVRFMQSPQIAIPSDHGPDQFYCLGWVRREARPYPIIWHNGGTSGAKAMIAFVPSSPSRELVGIVILSNLAETELPESLAWRFFDSYFENKPRDWSKEALDRVGKAEESAKAATPKRPASPAPPIALERYTGDYTSDIYGKATVVVKGTGLSISVGPKQFRIEAKPWDGNRFMGSWNAFGAPEDIGLVSFTAGGDGEPVDVVIDAFDDDGAGTFRKLVREPSGSPAAGDKPGPGREKVLIEGMSVTREKVSEIVKSSSCREFDKLYKEAVPVNGVRRITYEQFMRLKNSSDRFMLVDVLSADDYSTGHIPGAISLPAKTINPYNAANKIPLGSSVVVYCLDFNCPYSTDAALKLAGYGYRVLDYKGGLDEWQQKGNKLAK